MAASPSSTAPPVSRCRSLRYAYIKRKLRKRDFRRLWITRINAAGLGHRNGSHHFHADQRPSKSCR